MKNSNQYVTCFVLLIFLLAYHLTNAQDKPKGTEWKVPEKEAIKKSEIKFDNDAVKEGKDIWAQNCKSCHGTNGLGDGPKAAKIDISCGDFSSNATQDLSDGSLFWKITSGKKPMPAFNEKLNDSERWQLVAFIRTLGKTGNKSAAINKNVKDNSTQEKDNKTVKQDSTVKNINFNKVNYETIFKTDSSKTFSPEYLELKTEIDILRKEIKVINTRVDSLMPIKR